MGIKEAILQEGKEVGLNVFKFFFLMVLAIVVYHLLN